MQMEVATTHCCWLTALTPRSFNTSSSLAQVVVPQVTRRSRRSIFRRVRRAVQPYSTSTPRRASTLMRSSRREELEVRIHSTHFGLSHMAGLSISSAASVVETRRSTQAIQMPPTSPWEPTCMGLASAMDKPASSQTPLQTRCRRTLVVLSSPTIETSVTTLLPQDGTRHVTNHRAMRWRPVVDGIWFCSR
jgi:hypothetical protein